MDWPLIISTALAIIFGLANIYLGWLVYSHKREIATKTEKDGEIDTRLQLKTAKLELAEMRRDRIRFGDANNPTAKELAKQEEIHSLNEKLGITENLPEKRDS